jgi:TonB family protein
MRRAPLSFAALACSCAFFAATNTPLFAQEFPQSQPVHVQPGQLAQSTLPKPVRLPPTPRAPAPVTIAATSLSDAATKIATALDEFNATNVAVLDFARPQVAEWNRVGLQLAADFRADLATSAPGVKQMSRDDMLKYQKHSGLPQEDLALHGMPTYVLYGSGVDAWVMAEIKFTGTNSIVLEFTAHPVKRDVDFVNVELPMTMTPELAALVEPEPPLPLRGLPVAGTDGYTMPACDYCPQASYTDAAVKAKLQGEVLLFVAIEPSGAAGEIHVIRGLPFGLSEAAADSIRTWRFKPALGPDGKPAEVAQTVEFRFGLF